MSPSKKKKILLIQWNKANYDSLNHLQNLLGKEFQKIGFEIAKIDIAKPKFSETLSNLLSSGQVDFAMSFSGLGSDVFVNEELVWELHKIPLFNWYCDHPCYYPSRHKISSRWLINGFVFPDHAKYCNEAFNANGMTFQIHLGAPKRDLSASNIRKPIEKNNRIIYSKSGTNIGEIEKRWQGLPEISKFILFSAREELLYQNTENAFPIIRKIAEDKNVYLSPNNRFLLSLILELDMYVRGWRANYILNALLDYPVDVYGKSWDHINWSKAKGASYKGATDLKTNLKILPEYLGCLSMNPLIEDSTHDRVFYSIAENVVPISDSNRFSKSKLPLLENYAFKFDQESIISSMENVLKNPTEALERVESTRLVLEDEYSLGHAAKNILEFVSYTSFNFNS